LPKKESGGLEKGRGDIGRRGERKRTLEKGGGELIQKKKGGGKGGLPYREVYSQRGAYG